MGGKGPFGLLKNLQSSKEHILNDLNKDDYIPYIINRGMSFSQRSISYANMMNRYPDLSVREQYDYYHYALVKSKTFNRWMKATDETETEKLISLYFGYNKLRTKEACQILSEAQKQEIVKKFGKVYK